MLKLACPFKPRKSGILQWDGSTVPDYLSDGLSLFSLQINLHDFILKYDTLRHLTRQTSKTGKWPKKLSGTASAREVVLSHCCIVFDRLCGYEPFHSDIEAEKFKLILKCQFSYDTVDWQDVSENAKVCLSLLLVTFMNNIDDDDDDDDDVDDDARQFLTGLDRKITDPPGDDSEGNFFF